MGTLDGSSLQKTAKTTLQAVSPPLSRRIRPSCCQPRQTLRQIDYSIDEESDQTGGLQATCII